MTTQETVPNTSVLAPLGMVEPHAGLLKAPPDRQLLYKMMTVENFLRSVRDRYLHFNRIDSYADFPGADPYDGQQLPADQSGNAGAKFLRASEFSAADYYDRARARTYACCLSLENSEYIWTHYANGSAHGKVCVVFEFGKLRTRLNETLDPAKAALTYGGVPIRQIFSVNYGIVDYVEWDRHQANAHHLPNPIQYALLKAMRFREERELRITLSALGIGHFALNDGSMVDFPVSFDVPFDFRAALDGGTIQRLEIGRDTNTALLEEELKKHGIAVAFDST